MGNGLVDVALIGHAASEDHSRRDPVALGETEHVMVRLGGMHVVDAQVQRRTDFQFGQRASRGYAAGGIHQGGDGAAMDDPGFGVADNLVAVRQAQRQAFSIGLFDTHAQYLAVAQEGQEVLGTFQNNGVAHANSRQSNKPGMVTPRGGATYSLGSSLGKVGVNTITLSTSEWNSRRYRISTTPAVTSMKTQGLMNQDSVAMPK